MQTLLSLSAGPLEMLLDPATGHLRRLTLGDPQAGGVELVRGVYPAVRAGDWTTVPPRVEGLEVERNERAFRVVYTATCEDPALGMAFRWKGEVVGLATGVVTYDFVGEALADLRSNRIGFCVLHPGALPPSGAAGAPYTLTAPDGATSDGRFPTLVVPTLPMVGVRSIRRTVKLASGATASVSVLCDGDVFETEDQRNWSDASFKTYSRPSALPRPFDVAKGETFRQKVTVTVEGLDEGLGTQLRSAPSHARPQPPTASLAAGPVVAAPKVRLATDADNAAPDFTSLNANRPDAAAPSVAFSLHPQIHLPDELTIAESFVTHGVLVATARGFAPKGRVVVGPIRFAPKDKPDERIGGELHAAWLLASLARLTDAGAAEVVWDGSGWSDKADSPAARLFAAVSKATGEWRSVASTRPDEVTAIALGDTLIVANAWFEPRRVALPDGWGEPQELTPYSFAIVARPS
ncbi:MAG: hypothetical protein ACRCT8_05970 [Lacipirellulaceae bacterium]